MKKITQWTLTAVFLVTSSFAAAGVKSRTVEYAKGQQVFEGLLVYPDKARGNLPGVLMIHNWMGLTAETKKQAMRVADLGYVVFAADIYGKGIRPQSPAEAGALAGTYRNNRALFREHLQLGLQTLQAQAKVDGDKIIAAGYCFGGTGVLELARSGAAVQGVVSFHGGLDSPTPADGKNIKARVLVLHGADDPTVKPEDLAAFEQELRDAKVDWELVKYGNTVHSFTDVGAGNDNSTGAAYNESADLRSFEAFKDFSRSVFRPGPKAAIPALTR